MGWCTQHRHGYCTCKLATVCDTHFQYIVALEERFSSSYNFIYELLIAGFAFAKRLARECGQCVVVYVHNHLYKLFRL